MNTRKIKKYQKNLTKSEIVPQEMQNLSDELDFPISRESEEKSQLTDLNDLDNSRDKTYGAIDDNQEVENSHRMDNKSSTQPPKEYPNTCGDGEPPSLRPETLNDFQGQSELKKRILITLEASKSRKECLPHQLFAGPPGLGKTTLATILAKEMGAEIKITSGPSLEKPGDLATTLVSLDAHDILFIDEIHRLSPVIEEFLYPAMEDRKLDILVEGEGGPKSIRIDLKPFTLIGATTKPGNLSSPLRGRFQTIHRLELYNLQELQEIVVQSAKKLSVGIDPDAALEIAIRSRGTPRTANNHLLWVRDYATAKLKTNHISKSCALEALDAISIDKEGLDPIDRKILDTLCKVFGGGPVGVQSLSVACSEDPASIEDMHEPYLISQGYLKRTPQGRVASSKTRKLYGLKPLSEQGELTI